MRFIPVQFLLTFGLFAATLLPVAAAEPAAPTASQILRRMSDKLAAEKNFRFQAMRKIDPALLEGHALPEKALIAVTVLRPNMLAAQAVSKRGSLRLLADGNTLTIANQKTNHYATVPMRTTIDGLVEVLDENYGFVPPLADFLVSDPYANFRQQAHTVSSLGRAKVGSGFLGLGGVECDHLLLKGDVADAEIWIGVNDHLPHRFIATFHREGKPQLQIDFLKWDLAAGSTPADFSFTPSKGAQRIEMWTTARMAAALKKTATQNP